MKWPGLATRDLLRSERPDDVGVSVSYPLPGTLFYERVRAQLGARTNWSDSDDLAMMFQGTYTSAFYRRVRDLLHEEAAALGAGTDAAGEIRLACDEKWRELGETETRHRSEPLDPPGRALRLARG